MDFVTAGMYTRIAGIKDSDLCHSSSGVPTSG